MKIQELLEAQRGLFAKVVANPHRYVWDVLDAFILAGQEPPEYFEDEETGDTDEEEVANFIAQMAGEVLPFVKNGQMTIYRAIAVPENWVPRSLGIYWSYEIDGAYAYHEGIPHEDVQGATTIVILVGVVAEAGINIPQTIVIQEAAEREIRLQPGAQVRITSVLDAKTKQPTMPGLVGKVFPA